MRLRDYDHLLIQTVTLILDLNPLMMTETIDEKDNNKNTKSIHNLKYLIAPNPVGERGTFTTSGGSYFFNPIIKAYK
jgi:hypothetical protein